jgi:hypothetical protein
VEEAEFGAEQTQACVSQFLAPDFAHCSNAAFCAESLFPAVPAPTKLPLAATLAHVLWKEVTTWHWAPPCFLQFCIATLSAVGLSTFS